MEIEFDEPVPGKKIVAAMNSVARRMEGIGFLYTPYQIHYKGGDKLWFYDNLRLIVSSVVMKILADGANKMDAESDYSGIGIEVPEEDSDIALVREVLENFKNAVRSEVKRPIEDIAPSAKVATDKDGFKLPELSEEDRKRIDEGRIRILAIVQGEYGERIAKYISEKGPEGWEVFTIKLDIGLPDMIDDPDEFMPPDIPKADLLLSMQEESSAAQLIIDFAKAAEVRGVIAPIDNSEWLPEGMKNQIEQQLKEMGIDSVFPRPFCVLDETGHELFDQFAKCFGKPKLALKWENDRITEVEVLVNAACGSAEHVAKQLVGQHIDDAVEKAGLAHHHYPCLAAMKVEPDLEDTLMHVSGLQIKKAVDKILKPERKRKAVYIDPNAL